MIVHHALLFVVMTLCGVSDNDGDRPEAEIGQARRSMLKASLMESQGNREGAAHEYVKLIVH